MQSTMATDPSCCSCLRVLIKPFLKGSLTKKASVASVPHEKDITKAMASIAESVICFDENYFSVATSNGVRSYNEDRHRVISNLEAYHRAVMDQPNVTTFDEAQQAIQLEYEAPIKRSVNMLKYVSKHDQNKTRFFGVFDGHGGERCSSIAALLFPWFLLQSDSFANDLEKALEQTCCSLNREILTRSVLERFEGGSTAVVLVLRGNVAYISNIGDSRAILISRQGTSMLSTDHKVTNVDEKKRIEDAGGVIVYVKGVARVNGRLAVARALGDAELQKFVIAKPDILRHEIRPDDQYIVMASDGLWDTLSNDQVTSCIKNNPWLGPQELSQILLKRALENGSTDNITVMVVDIHQKKRE